jgi:GNAT superfamily N-acetyltransferase
MSAPVVRIAAAADAPALAALRRAWTAEWNPGGGGAGDEGFEARFLDWYQREAARRVTWLAEVSGEPAGMVNLTVFERMPQPGRDPGSWGYLGNAFVLPAHRNQGIGSRLLRALLDYTDARGYVRVVLNPSERSGPLYRRFGFSAEHGLLVRRRPALAGPRDQRGEASASQRSPWYSAGGPSCAPITGANAAE